ncbi:carboxymuconolactone decarboxylase family protein [Parasphingorhabdus sp.]|uniref:carboxymuconolactone decarboxylase family protein n=1 Tax=Parasphingorhabdus sp. TaxID=2709688 RepID=UPI003A8CDC3C
MLSRKDNAGGSIPPIGLAPDLEGASPEQMRLIELMTAGPRGSVPLPFLAMMDAPLLAEAIQQVGAVLRFSSSLGDADREVAILATAGAVGCGYEWNYHRPIAVAAGVDATVIAATRPDAAIDGNQLSQPAMAIIALCRAVAASGAAPADLLADMVAQLDRKRATELIAIAGYYALLANFIKSAGFDEPFPSD